MRTADSKTIGLGSDSTRRKADAEQTAAQAAPCADNFSMSLRFDHHRAICLPEQLYRRHRQIREQLLARSKRKRGLSIRGLFRE